MSLFLWVFLCALAPGSDSYGYNAVGNQTTRPAGMKLTCTPFDLPKTIKKQGASAITFAYDGDEQRIRKTTPVEETLYFEGLYERVTATGTATEHRYYVHSPERVVAVVTRGGKQPGTRYTHVDHLGSVDALTDEGGGVVERRSYDPFGQRRNPVWGQPVPASFPSLTTQGFTGHESDDELGLVNMKGRIYDPKVGRFLTTDPIVSAPLSGQGWNPYSYVLGRPLSFVDPSGFEGLSNPPGPSDVTLPDLLVTPGPAFQMGQYLMYAGPRPKSGEGPPQAEEVGAAVPPVDVGTTGNASGYVPQLSAAVAAVPFGAPGLPGSPLGAPGAPLPGPLSAPGPFVPDAFGPGSFVEPPLPGAVPLRAPGLPAVTAEAPGVTGGGLLGGVLFVLTMGATFSGDAPVITFGPDGIPNNKLGEPYPRWPDVRTGQSVIFPEGLVGKVPPELRTDRDPHQKRKFIIEWHDRGYPRPPNNWDDLEIHHIKPLERGGTNDFWNLVPLPQKVHDLFTDYWRNY